MDKNKLNILTLFAGREHFLKINLQYVEDALARGIIDQVHIWNFTYKPSDCAYLLARYPSVNTYHPHPAQLAKYKIVVIGRVGDYSNWGNRISPVRKEILRYISQLKNKICLKRKKAIQSFLSFPLWSYTYYPYYAQFLKENPGSVVIKMDDDICFFDVARLKQFIEYVRYDSTAAVVSANVVNNGLAASRMMGAGVLSPIAGVAADDTDQAWWKNSGWGNLAHTHFLDNREHYTSLALTPSRVRSGVRMSINFVATKHYQVMQRSIFHKDDEACWSQHEYQWLRQFRRACKQKLSLRYIEDKKAIQSICNIISEVEAQKIYSYWRKRKMLFHRWHNTFFPNLIACHHSFSIQEIDPVILHRYEKLALSLFPDKR